MTRRSRVLVIGLAVVTALLAVLGVSLSRDAACEPVPAPAAGAAVMKAVVRRCYGPPGVLALETVARPAVGDSDVLVRVRAASINPLDWHFARGKPYLMRFDVGFGRPKDPRVGVDFAGVVEAVGVNVTTFKPGDEVFGGRTGALAEFVAVPAGHGLVRKPATVSFDEAATVAIAGLTALQGLRDQGHLRAGQKVLINGASGGVGTFAVQLAKSFGAEVTGVCSSKNVELVRSIGADHVVDYGKEDFTRNGVRYDVILDNVGNRSMGDLRRALTPKGTAVIVGGGGADEGPWIGPLVTPIKAMLLSPFVSQKLTFFLARINDADLATMAGLMEAGTVKPVIDRRYKLSEAAAALEYLEGGHARGKVVITVE